MKLRTNIHRASGVGTAKKVFKVRGRRSSSWPDQLTCISGGM